MAKNNKQAEQSKTEELSNDELGRVQGAATEELKGSHNFLLEVSGISSAELKPRTSPTHIRALKRK